MPVSIYSRDMLEPLIVEGDLVTVVNNLNVAAANGKQFAIMTEEGYDENGCAIEIRNITRMREQKGAEDAFIGR